MEQLKLAINNRQTYITMTLTLRNVLPPELIKYIMSFIPYKQINYPKTFNKDVHEIMEIINIKEKIFNGDIKLTIGAYNIINCLIISYISKITDMSILLSQHARTKTITSREIQSATRMLGNNQLCKYMVSSGTKAVTIYNATLSDVEPKQEICDAEETHSGHKRQSVKQKCGSKLNPTKILSFIKLYTNDNFHLIYDKMRIGEGAPVYLAGCLDEIIKLLIISSRRGQILGEICTESVLNGLKNEESLKKLFFELFI